MNEVPSGPHEQVNPYIAGSPVTGTEMFYGREDVFSFVQRNLIGRHRDTPVVLYGQRRTGKTSVLYQLHRHLDASYRCIFIDLHGLNLHGMGNLMLGIANSISRGLQRDHRLAVEVPDRAVFLADPRSAFETLFLDRVWAALGNDHLVLMLDEVIRLDEEVRAGRLERDIFDYLRHLMQHYPRLNFIFSLGSGLEEMARDYAFLFSVSLYHRISFLEPEAARELITQPVRNHYRVAPQAVTRILQITSGHPYYTQLVCHCIFDVWSRSPQPIMSAADVDAVMAEAIELGSANLTYVWEDSAPGEQALMAGMAAVTRRGAGPVTVDQVQHAWRKVAVSLPEHEVIQALRSLTSREVIAGRHTYSFTVDLQRLWLEKHRRLDWVKDQLAETVRQWNRSAEPVPAGTIPIDAGGPELAAGPPVSVECPYPGLAAFQPSDSERFFGRGRLTAELVARAGEQVVRPGLLIVVGLSGAGKSSLLRAGFLPAVAAGALPARGSGAWPRVLMTPGPRPLLELATRIAPLAGISAEGLEADLRGDPARITGAIRQALLTHARRETGAPGHLPATELGVINPAVSHSVGEPDAGGSAVARRTTAEPRLVLVVDQFEEVFTQCTDAQEQRAFIKALCAAAGAADPSIAADDGPVRGQADARDAPAVIVTGLRADFYGRCAAFPELATHLQDHQVLVGPIDEAGLREAIEKPAAAAGLVVDAALVELLLADLGIHPHRPPAPASTAEEPAATDVPPGQGSYTAGRLALLSYALQQTWRNREGRRLTVAGYRATGGIDRAVAQAADGVCDKLDRAGQDALRRVLLRLVALGEGTPDSRRRVNITELTGTDDTERDAPTRMVLADLISARLVTADENTVEITHETLLTAWPRLRNWLTEDRAGLRIHRELTAAAHDWQRERRDPSRLFRGTRLAVAQDWAASHGQDLNTGERAFLAASRHDQRRTTRRRRAAVAALAALTLVSAAAAGVAIQQRKAALTARDQAIANQIAFEAGQLKATDPSLAAQLELAANQISPTPDSETHLLDTTTTPLSSHVISPRVESVVFSPDGKTVAAAGDGKVWLWNLTHPAHPTKLGQPLTGLRGPAGAVESVAFSPDGKTLAAGGGSKVWLWNLTHPAHPTKLGPLRTGLRDPLGPGYSVAFSPDGKTLAAAGGGEVWLWDFTHPTHPTKLRQPPPFPGTNLGSVTFSPDGKTLAAAGGGEVWLWDFSHPAHPTKLRPLQTLPGTDVTSMTFSPDGKTLATTGFDGKIWLWDFTQPAHPTKLGQPLTGPRSDVGLVAFSPDGKTLAAAGFDGKIWLWDFTHRAHPTKLGQPLTGSTSEVTSLAFSPDGKTLAAASGFVTIRFWNLPSNVMTGPAGTVDSVAFSPDGKTLAAAGGGEVWLWDSTNPTHPTKLGQPLTVSTDPADVAGSVAFSPDGKTLAAGGYHGKIWLWDTTNPAHPTKFSQPPTGPTKALDSVAFSPDGKTLAAGAIGGEVWLWDFTQPAHPTKLGQPLTGPRGHVDSVAFSPDGKTLAAASGQDDKLWLWDFSHPAHPTKLRPLQTLPGYDVTSVAFSPDGKILAAGGYHGKIWLWDTTNPAHPTKFSQPLTGSTSEVTSLAFSPDGKTLAAGSIDDKVWLWDSTNPAHPTKLGQPLTGPRGTAGTVDSVAFSPDGKTLAAGGSGTLHGGIIAQTWNLDVDYAIERICATTGNSLTPGQWNQYIPQLPYNPPCTHPGHYGLLVH